MTMTNGYPLVDDRHFVHASRDTGYRCTSAALAELVDNAIQAGASRIGIHVREDRQPHGREISIAVRDNGCGMDAEQLQRGLQWGGTTRFNDRSGLGRFGMGLPNSSVSQARRVEVYTWQPGSDTVFSYLDVDDVDSGTMRAVPTPVHREPPDWVSRRGRSGTVVLWRKCDRLDYRKASTLRAKLADNLGRAFRRLIWDGVRISINGRAIPGMDPLFLHSDAPHADAREPVPPLVYPIRCPDGRVSEVTVRFSILPVAAWQAWPIEQKRRLGIIGGAGVSVLRARREIANGWFFMNGKRRQNYDDWWRAEVSFNPSIDELMGVTHSKQGIRPTREISEILSPAVGEVAGRLSTEVRQQFAALKPAKPSRAAVVATSRDWRLPPIPLPGGNGGRTRMSQVRYRIIVADLADPDFFTWTVMDGEIVLAINRNHPFFRSLYGRLSDGELGWVREEIEAMLLAYARAEAGPGAATAPQSLLRRWSDAVATFMGD